MPALEDWRPWTCRKVFWRLAPAWSDKLPEKLTGWSSDPSAVDRLAVLKTDRGRSVTAMGELVFKRFTVRSAGLRHLPLFAIRPSRARRACRLALALRSLGLPVPEPLAYGRERGRVLTTAEIIVARRIADAIPLTVILNRQPADPAVLKTYGELLGRFHRHGFSNRDLKDENVLCDRNDSLSMWVADLDGVRYHRCLTRFRCARDLRALIRSLAICGQADVESTAALLAGYNAAVPERLRWRRLPWFGKQALELGISKRAAADGGVAR